jgi:hypothetical protein
MIKFPSFIFLCLLPVILQAQTSFTFPEIKAEFDSAITVCNLQLIPLKRIETSTFADTVMQHGTIRLQQGLQTKKVMIKERGNYMLENINVLLIENRSGKDLIIKSGEIVTGGRQDRVFARDTVLSSSSKPHIVPVYCIEEDRWSRAEKKFIHRGTIASGLQKIIDSSHSQALVWDEIRKLLKQNNQTSSQSYAMLMNHKKLTDTAARCMAQLYNRLRMADSSYTGFIAVTGNRIIGAELFINPSLFYQTLSSLLEKYGSEAALTGTTPSVSLQQKEAYANELLNSSTQNSFIAKKGKRFFYRGVLIQLSTH